MAQELGATPEGDTAQDQETAQDNSPTVEDHHLQNHTANAEPYETNP